MRLILNNPYRITGLLVGATAKEQDRQVRRLRQYIEAEQEPDEDYSFPILGELPRTIADVENAVSKLNLDSDKMSASLFWFYKGNAITDEPAFEALKDGDIETAYQIWNKMITEIKEDGKKFWKPVTEKNFSAFHNCTVLNIVRPNGNLNNAIAGGIFFLESDLVHNFVSTVADSTYKLNKKDLQLSFLNQLFSDIEYSKKISVIKFVEIVSKLQFSAKQDFLKSFVQKSIKQVERLIEESKTKRKANKANAVNNGNTLYQQTAENIKQLKSILGASDIKFSSVADKVANELLQCSIDYFNDSQEKDSNTDYAETAMKLAKLADSIAVGNIIKDRIKDSITTLEGMKDREISQAIEVLKSIKQVYENNERQVMEQVKIQEASLPWGQSINWSKVVALIRNSLDWAKVTQLIQEVIPQKNIEKIKSTNNPAQINEYKTLVNFLLDKLSYSYKNRLSYLRYWETQKTTSSSNSNRPMSTTTNNEKSSAEENSGCRIVLIILIIIGVIILFLRFSFTSKSDNYGKSVSEKKLFFNGNSEDLEEDNSYDSYYYDNDEETEEYNSDY